MAPTTWSLASGVESGLADGDVVVVDQRQQRTIETGYSDFAEHFRGKLAISRIGRGN